MLMARYLHLQLNVSQNNIFCTPRILKPGIIDLLCAGQKYQRTVHPGTEIRSIRKLQGL
jgi:hypothetical protein